MLVTTTIIQTDLDELRSRGFTFDRHNPNWTENTEHNLFFLRTIQNRNNDILRARGHVLLNDILDSIGMVRTLEGAIIGWALSFEESVHIEFEFIENKLTRSLDVFFNLQGVILDQMIPAHAISVARFDITSPHNVQE